MDGHADQVQAGVIVVFFVFSLLSGKQYSRNPWNNPVFFILFLLLFVVSEAFATETLPAPVNRLLYQVSRLYEHEEYARAAELVEKFRKSAESYADYPDVLFAQGNCCIAMQKYQCAVRSYRKVVSARPEFAAAWQNMAGALYNLGRYEDAAHGFARAFDVEKTKNPEMLYYSGVCFLMAENGHEAADVLQRLLNEFSAKAKPEWHEAMVRALVVDNRSREALPLLRELVSTCTGEKKKQWAEFLLYQYLQLGMNRSAGELAHELARTWPLEERWWKAVAHAALKQGDMEDAVMALTILSFIRPLDTKEARLLADLNLNVDIPVKALPVYEKLLAERPSPELLKYVIYACRKLGTGDRALELLETYRKVALQDLSLVMMQGDILYGTSRYRDALDAYMQAANLGEKGGRHGAKRMSRSERGRAWLMAGYCAWQVNDLETADRAFSMAARFASQKKQALEAMRLFARRYNKKSQKTGRER